MTLSTDISGLIECINQLHDMEKKVAKLQETNSLHRNMARFRDIFEQKLHQQEGILWQSPVGEAYEDTRTDVEANVVGTATDHLVIVDVIKPIIYLKKGDTRTLIQRGVVVVQSK